MAARKTPSKGGKPDKLMRDALILELKQEVEENGQRTLKLRQVARKLVNKAIEGDVTAIKELNDRVDGKSPQTIMGDDDAPAIRVTINRKETAVL